MKRYSSLLGAVLAALASMAMLAAVASAATPAPGYERFAGCPSPAENPNSEVCIRSVITGGHFQMGNKDVPISKPMVLTGGVNNQLQNFSANSAGGLTKVKQQVPGGVIGLTGLDWLVNFLGVEQLKLYAVTELVGPPTLGETLHLPLRVHLINPVLGNNCYVGTASNPITLNLTEGTTNPPPPNTPITGKRAEFGFDEATEILTLMNSEAVDNSFSAPGASGCTLTLFGFIPVSINGLVNSTSGLPAPAGTNETRQIMDMELAPVTRVYP
jgi:hypothetical protein